MAVIKTKLDTNLRTEGRLEDGSASVKTAYLDPRSDMNPGELLCASLAACMLTMVGFVASKRSEDLTGTELTVDPVFDQGHTRVTQMNLIFSFPASLTQEQKDFYVKAASSCPVHNSLREDIVFNVSVK